MYDTLGAKYMLLESYPLITTQYDFSITNHCDETCYLNELNPDSLEIQLINAEVYVNILTYATDGEGDLAAQQYSLKQEMDDMKVDTMNTRIEDFNMEWTAGDNSLLDMFYSQKEILFGEKYNLFGYDYYVDGVFQFLDQSEFLKGDADLVWSFDWRDRHGANDSLSAYYDGDTTGTGWLTSAKDQMSCNNCWAFSAVGVTEALTNLFANDHLDLDLSEQHIVSCSGAGSCTGGGSPEGALSFIADSGGIMTEYCFEYDTVYIGCNSTSYCSPVETLLEIEDYETGLSINVDDLRKNLIDKGPLLFTFPGSGDLNHAVVLSGYEFDFIDSTINWIIKDSRGSSPPKYGFRRLKLDNIKQCQSVSAPVYINDTIIADTCRDVDGDKYCWWGMGDRPVDCNCQDTLDCDDTNPYVGGYDENYYCSCILKPDTNFLVISADTTWSDTTFVGDMIFIESDACLTISTYVAFGDEAGIIVEQGAKLLVDGGYLTKACNDLWLGIEAWGSDTTQALKDDYFGQVEIKNGSVIEYAETAVANHCQTCDHYLMQSGGIIVADSSTFRNNVIDVHFESFQNMHSGNEYPYQSSFKECTFLTDLGLYEFAIPEAHIRLEEIYGLGITSCYFKNEVSKIKGFTDRGTGILSYDGHFNIKNNCLVSEQNPCQGYDSCRFEYLEYGIKAVFSTSQRTLSIRDMVFDNNVLGVSFSGIDNTSLLKNYFKCGIIPPEDTSNRFYGGTFLEGCSGYRIEENIFDGKAIDTGGITKIFSGYGLGIKNSGTADNEVYKNTFSDLAIGIAVIGENRGRSGGLCLKCNNMTNNDNDFIVVEDDAPVSGSLQGIAYYQGSLEDTVTGPAGNLFTSYNSSQVGVSSGDTLQFWNYFNEGDTIRYIHHSTGLFNIAPADSNYTTESIFLTEQSDLEFDNTSACPSKIESSNNLKSFCDPRGEMNHAAYFISDYQQQLQDVIDGGDTESLNFDVLMSVPEDALDIRQQLMDESPYLSDTVMKQAIYKEYVLPNAMLRDVLVANPQSAKKNEIMDYLNTRIESIPDYMLAEIYEGNDYFGAKEILESKIEYWQQIRNSAKYKLLKSYVLDSTITNPYDSLITFYSNESDIHSRYNKAFCHFGNGDIDQAIISIELIPGEFDLSNHELSEHNGYVTLFNIIEMTQDSGWSEYHLDSVCISSLQEISSNDFAPLSSYTRGLLMKGGYIEYLEQFNLPLNFKHSNPTTNLARIDPEYEDNESLWIFPNPAKEFVIVHFELPEKENSKGIISLSDSQGKLLQTISLLSNQNQITINLRGLASGNYHILLIHNEEIIDIKKLVIN